MKFAPGSDCRLFQQERGFHWRLFSTRTAKGLADNPKIRVDGQWIRDEFGLTVSKQTLARELRALGYRKLSARPRHHAQAAGAIEAFKKVSPRAWTRSGARRVSAAAA